MDKGTEMYTFSTLSVLEQAILAILIGGSTPSTWLPMSFICTCSSGVHITVNHISGVNALQALAQPWQAAQETVKFYEFSLHFSAQLKSTKVSSQTLSNHFDIYVNLCLYHHSYQIDCWSWNKAFGRRNFSNQRCTLHFASSRHSTPGQPRFKRLIIWSAIISTWSAGPAAFQGMS